MQISHKYKFIFFSFPKTGSESVRELLDPYSDIQGTPYWERTNDNPFYSHISPIEVKNIFEKKGWDYDEYYKFTFVRNPWARIVSLYNMIYHTTPPGSLAGKIRAKLKLIFTPTFKQWLSTIKPYAEGASGPSDQRWQVYGAYSIKNYILDNTGKSLVDEVIKLEEIDISLPPLLKKLGIPEADTLTIPFVNKRPSKSYLSYYDDESRDLVSSRYKYEIEMFNYEFDDTR